MRVNNMPSQVRTMAFSKSSRSVDHLTDKSQDQKEDVFQVVGEHPDSGVYSKPTPRSSAEENNKNISSLINERSEILAELEKVKDTEVDIPDHFKIMLIATRILNGDIVPYKDELFLAENDSALYLKVKLLAAAKENPIEHDSLVEDDENPNFGQEIVKAGYEALKQTLQSRLQADAPVDIDVDVAIES